MDRLETKKYNLTGSNSDLFGNVMVVRIHSVSIKENKEKENDGIKTHSFETIFTNRDGYTFKLIAPKVRFKKYSVGTPLIMNESDINIELLLNVLEVNKVKYELIDITNYHKMTLKEIEKELGYKIKLIEK
ncbi:MAG: hypothetical protein GX638_00035 [Crenarchaeota archaeon]|nr:hypothetical protein [Thermoproteota archaeon]